jgi:hypothetical protein
MYSTNILLHVCLCNGHCLLLKAVGSDYHSVQEKNGPVLEGLYDSDSDSEEDEVEPQRRNLPGMNVSVHSLYKFCTESNSVLYTLLRRRNDMEC